MNVKVGQVWRDKDKRRPKQGTITRIWGAEPEGSGNYSNVTVQFDGDDDRTYKLERFVKRWEKVSEDAIDKKKADRIHKAATKAKDGEAIYSTREAWLEAGVKALEPLFEPIEDVTIPKVRVSVGWPGGRGPKGNVIGQCWKTETASDNVSQIFVSPVVAEPVKALATLAHEMIHASDDGASRHRGHFARVATALGFTGKLTVVNPSDELTATLTKLADALGPYPHAAISVKAQPKTQKTYMIKVESIDCEICGMSGYLVRMTQKWLDEYGVPKCPHGVAMEVQ